MVGGFKEAPLIGSRTSPIPKGFHTIFNYPKTNNRLLVLIAFITKPILVTINRSRFRTTLQYFNKHLKPFSGPPLRTVQITMKKKKK